MKLLLLSLIMTMAACTGDQPPLSSEQARKPVCPVASGEHRDGDRLWIADVPADADSDTPLIVVMHGAMSAAAPMPDFTGFREVTDAILIYPQAQGSPPDTVWQPAPDGQDVAFVSRLIHDLQAQGCGSPERTTVAGFSLGAMTAARVGCAHPAHVAGIAMIAGGIAPTKGCRLDPRTSVLVLHGREDDVLPVDGRDPAWLRSLVGISKATPRPKLAARWAAAKGCSSSVRRTRTVRGVLITVPECASPTVALIVRDMGHTWSPDGLGPAWTSRRIVRVATAA